MFFLLLIKELCWNRKESNNARTTENAGGSGVKLAVNKLVSFDRLREEKKKLNSITGECLIPQTVQAFQ